MKKMKFTLGLMLSMLFLGASVSYAQTYISSLPHSGAIESAIWVQGCDYYAANITFKKMVKDDNGDYGYPGTYAVPTVTDIFILNYKNVPFDDYAFVYFPVSMDWQYGSGHWTTWPTPSAQYPNVADYYFDRSANKYFTNTAGSTSKTDGNLFYWLEKSKTEVINQIEVSLNYENGNELMPVLKRSILLGEWKTVHDPITDTYRNELFPTSIYIEQELDFDKGESRFRPDMDRGDAVATYVFKDQILPLLDKYIIYGMYYELAVYDEFDNVGGTNYQPSQTLPKDVRKVYIEAADGIKTTPNSIGSAIFVPSLQNFVFTAVSASEITAETITLHQPFGAFDEIRFGEKKGVLVTNNKNGTYTITIQYVNQEMLIRVNSVASLSSGETGNDAIAADNVWAASGTLFVQAANTATLSVYTVTGQLFFQKSVSGSFSMTLPKGLYIVQLNGKAYKVIN